MSAVLYGRRKGEARKSPDIPVDTMPSSKAVLPSEKDLRRVTILSQADWERVQMQLNKRAREEEIVKRERDEREKLHKLSQDRVKHWSHTIAGQRQRKLEAREKRERKEEEERHEMDLEEAQYQAEMRREAIEKAKTQQYYQTDRVKGFHGALLLTEVLKEREAQLELKVLKDKANDGQDEFWLEAAQKQHQEAILKDHEEALDRMRNTRENAQFQKSQVAERQRQEHRKEDDLRTEGEELRLLAARNAIEKKKLEEIHSNEAKMMMSDNLRQIDEVKHMRNLEKQQQEEEDEECRIFANAKRKMMKLRAVKEAKLHSEKQEKLDKIRSKLHAQMQQRIDDEGDRMKNALEESELKTAQEEAEKEAKSRKMLQSISDHRHEQMKLGEKLAADQRRNDREMVLARKEADRLFRENEDRKYSRRRDESRDLESFLLTQKGEKMTNAMNARQHQLLQDRRNEELVATEEAQFQEYANNVIENARKGGRQTYPLRRAAKEGAGGGLGPVFPGKGGLRPSYMVADGSGVQLPNYQQDSTDDVKQDIYSGPTNKRLGFVW